MTVDYYSDYFELDFLSDTTAESLIDATKRHFARHGIADMVTDNGPQYSSAHFNKFANGNFSTLPVHHYVAKAMGKLSRQSKSQRIW